MEIDVASTFSDQEIFTYANFKKEIKRLDCVSSLMGLQKISALLRNQVLMKINLEFEFQISPKIRHTMYLTRHCISFLAKEIILNCTDSSKGLNELDIVRLANQYEHLKTYLINPDSPKSWLWVLRMTNLQHYYYRIPGLLMARYYFIFSHILRNDVAFRDVLNNTLGLDILDIFKIGFCVYATLNEKTFFCLKSIESTTVLKLKNLLSKDNINKFIAIFSIDQSGFLSEYSKLKSKNIYLKKYEFNPLRRYPIIKTTSKIDIEEYIIPSAGDFVYSFSEGLYYVLLDKLNDHQKSEFFKQIGSIFEDYIGNYIRYYNIDILSRCILYREILYKFKKNYIKSADWLLVSDELIFQIECKKRKLDTHTRAGVNFMDKGINSTINSIAKELDKLAEKEVHIQNNMVNNIVYRGQKIINIIVYLDEMFSINQYARKSIIGKITNPQNDFYILGCYEFEILCQICRNKNLSLIQALMRFEALAKDVYDIDFLSDVLLTFHKSLFDT